ncbi:amidase domain-containing protein [Brevibacillus sp. NRS-1366]|uniref:amidase domain-containing protein n=1 Tax=Brevibacillus sp. NRS-1366 TaxID=3233899 RepID=UPI003D262DF6
MGWRGFVQRYFDAVHQSWIDGEYNRLLPFYMESKQVNTSEWERLNREHRQAEKRGALLRSVTGRVVPLCWMETDSALEITFSWEGRRQYVLEQGQHRYEEASQRLLQLRLHKGNDQWSISGTREWDGDSKDAVNHEQEELIVPGSAVEDAITQPLLVVHGAGGYNPERAVAYAERYWNTTNPAYPRFTDDCTNFISQCLHAGGIPMLFSKEKGKGWWMRTGKGGEWSYSWAVAHSLYLMLKSGGAPMRAVVKSSAAELVPGDIICYDFDGDGRFQHNTIVVAKDANDMPLVNAHTTDSSMRFWAYEDSTAYTPNMRYAFFHIRGM